MGYNERLKKWSCENCKELKQKTVTKKDLKDINKNILREAIKGHNYERLKLEFPFTDELYRKVRREGECTIFYCTKGLFRRRVYQVKENFKDNSIINKENRCPRYR